ncbi:MAG: rhodanese-like domain-containing protein [Rhodothermales bacterium]|nr:rhodanese-like domain-containing protein [Rhodothermales bacterium]
MKWFAFILFVSAPVLTGCSQDTGLSAIEKLVRAQYPDVDQISTEELARRLGTDTTLVLIDTRTREEYDVSHLPGAIWVDPESTTFPELGERVQGKSVIAYCSVGYRSSEIAARMKDAGFEDVSNLEGSIFRWANEGRPVVTNSGPATGVHPFSRTWSRLLNDDLHDYGTATESGGQ